MSSEWPILPLGKLTINYDGKRRPVKESERKPGPYPYYGASGIVDHVDGYIFDGTYLLIGEDGENMRTRQTPIAFMATGKFWVNNHAHIVTGNDLADTQFLMYSLANSDIHSYLTGAVMPKLTQGNLNKILLACPPLGVQKDIVGILGALDDRITLLRETNATLEAIAQALFKSWFVDFDPVRAKLEGRAPVGMDEATAALFPDGFEESELGLVPRGWRVLPIGDAVEAVGGATPDTKNPAYWEPAIHCWTTPKDLSGIAAPVLLDTERKLSDQGLAKIGSGALPIGTLLLSSRAPIGYLALAQVPLAINQGYIAMLPGGLLPPLYMLFWCRQNMESIKGRANGSTFMEISKKAFRPIPALVPPPEIVQAFVEVAGVLFERLIENEKQAQTLATLRDTLLPRLISGQLRLPEVS
jgi:type I restriction enzyme, S subunit